MKLADFVIAGVVGGSWLMSVVARRTGGGRRELLAMGSLLVGHLGMGVELALVSAQEAQHGGAWWALFPLTVILAAFSLAFAGVMVWAWSAGRLKDP